MVKKIVKEQHGWVIVQHFKNGKPKQSIIPYFDHTKGHYTSITGYGELYYSKSVADHICKDLNSQWSFPYFKVLPATLVIFKELKKGKNVKRT